MSLWSILTAMLCVFGMAAGAALMVGGLILLIETRTRHEGDDNDDGGNKPVEPEPDGPEGFDLEQFNAELDQIGKTIEDKKPEMETVGMGY